MAVRRSLIPTGLFAAAIVAAWSCGDPTQAGPDLQAPALDKDGRWATSSSADSSLVPCAQTYDSVTQVIGPAGGLMAVGPHFLWVDTMALSEPVAITAVAPSDTVRWVRFEPDGLQFRTNGAGWSALLYTSYKNCGLPTQDSLRIARVTGNLSILGYLERYVGVKKKAWSNGNQYVAGILHHFSQYAVA